MNRRAGVGHGGNRAAEELLREAKRIGTSDEQLAQIWKTTPAAVRHRSAPRHGIAPVFKRVDTCAAEFESFTPYMYSTYEDEDESEPTEQAEDRHSRQRPEPHRAGNRIRLLLLPCLLRAARRRLRNHHGQLQSGDGLDRLRHLRPPVFRAAHARRRSRRGRTRKAARRDRAVRRADAAESGAGTEAQRRAHHRHRAGIDRSGRRPPPLRAPARRIENSAAAQRHGAGARRGRARRQRNRLSGAGAPQLRAGRARHGDRLRFATRCRNTWRRRR